MQLATQLASLSDPVDNLTLRRRAMLSCIKFDCAHLTSTRAAGQRCAQWKENTGLKAYRQLQEKDTKTHIVTTSITESQIFSGLHTSNLCTQPLLSTPWLMVNGLVFWGRGFIKVRGGVFLSKPTAPQSSKRTARTLNISLDDEAGYQQSPKPNPYTPYTLNPRP